MWSILPCSVSTSYLATKGTRKSLQYQGQPQDLSPSLVRYMMLPTVTGGVVSSGMCGDLDFLLYGWFLIQLA